MSGSRLVLVGPPGAGKSTVGSALAARIEAPFVDTDTLVEQQAGKSVAEIFVDDGEPAFRAMESAAVLSALTMDGAIVALGGGAITNERTRGALTDVDVVLLEVDASDAAKRVGMNGARPLLLGDVRSRLVTLMRERAPWYAEVATVTVSTSGRAVADIVDEIERWLVDD